MTPIATWSNPNSRPHSIELYSDSVWVYYTKSFPPRKFNVEEFLLADYPVGELKLDSEVLLKFISHQKSTVLSKEAQDAIDFYKALNFDLLSEGSVEPKSKEGDYIRYHSFFSKFGLEERLHREDGVQNSSYGQRLHHFYFYGPMIPQLPLEIRSQWKLNIQSALNSKDILPSAPLFDYGKIAIQRFETNSPNYDSGDFIEIKGNHVMIGGFGPGGGGAQPFSVETIFHKGEKHLPDSLKRYYDEIKLILAKGIIEE